MQIMGPLIGLCCHRDIAGTREMVGSGHDLITTTACRCNQAALARSYVIHEFILKFVNEYNIPLRLPSDEGQAIFPLLSLYTASFWRQEKSLG